MTRLLSLFGLMRGQPNKPMQARSAETLEQHIMDRNIAKSDAEWWARERIQTLQADLEKQAGEIALLKSDVSELQGHLYDARHDLDASRQQAAELLPDALAMRRKRQMDRDRRKRNG